MNTFSGKEWCGQRGRPKEGTSQGRRAKRGQHGTREARQQHTCASSAFSRSGSVLVLPLAAAEAIAAAAATAAEGAGPALLGSERHDALRLPLAPRLPPLMLLPNALLPLQPRLPPGMLLLPPLPSRLFLEATGAPTLLPFSLLGERSARPYLVGGAAASVRGAAAAASRCCSGRVRCSALRLPLRRRRLIGRGLRLPAGRWLVVALDAQQLFVEAGAVPLGRVKYIRAGSGFPAGGEVRLVPFLPLFPYITLARPARDEERIADRVHRPA